MARRRTTEPTEQASQPEAQPKAKAKATHVKAEVEYRKFNAITGEKLSNPFNQYYLPEEWTALQVHGPRRGLFVNKVIEAPDGVDTSYSNPK